MLLQKTSNTPTHSKAGSRGRGQYQQLNRGRGRGRSQYNNRGPSQSHFTQGIGKIPCQVCNRMGHTAFQCYRRFNHAFATDSESSPNALYASQSYPNKKWYPDSGPTNHIALDLANLSSL